MDPLVRTAQVAAARLATRGPLLPAEPAQDDLISEAPADPSGAAKHPLFLEADTLRSRDHRVTIRECF